MTSGARGFTLLEMLVVLALMGLASALAFPMLSNVLGALRYEQSVDAAFGLASSARAAAIRTGAPVTLALDAAAGRLRIGGEAPLDLAPAIVASGPGAITFMQDGSASGGSFQFRWRGRTTSLVVDQVSGRASLRGAQ